MARGRALIVDDSSTARIILARLLQKANIRSEGAVSAEEGLELLQRESFDLIFLDHLLPGMTGFDALDKLKHNPETAGIPVFMYTSQNAERYLEDARAKGAAGVISKQIDRDQLLSTIDAILSGEPHAEPPTLELETNSEHRHESGNARGVTGRLATLEIAYEDTHDELHQIKTSIARLQAKQMGTLEKRYKTMRNLWIVTLTCFVVAGLIFSFQLTQLSAALETVNAQYGVVREIVGNLVELVGTPQE
jgi:CheY-like chemotaxis protein